MVPDDFGSIYESESPAYAIAQLVDNKSDTRNRDLLPSPLGLSRSSVLIRILCQFDKCLSNVFNLGSYEVFSSMVDIKILLDSLESDFTTIERKFDVKKVLPFKVTSALLRTIKSSPLLEYDNRLFSYEVSYNIGKYLKLTSTIDVREDIYGNPINSVKNELDIVVKGNKTINSVYIVLLNLVETEMSF
jgi:hypothetical protein